MAKLRVVLVEPQEAGNVGAVARVMKNFGFSELVIVGRHPQLLPVAGWWASGSDDVLEASRKVPTLSDALRGAVLTVATTSARGRTSPADLRPDALRVRFGELGPDDTMALVFGREDSGLTRREAMLCQQTAVIPTVPAFPTMNLAQAAGVFCYQLSQAAGPPHSPRLRADSSILERLHERLQSLLLQIGYLHQNNPDRIYDDIRTMAGRADLDHREVTILLGIVRQLEWRMRQ
jgi:tRNA/rRNA methyltransferase